MSQQQILLQEFSTTATGGTFTPDELPSLVHWWDGRDEANILLISGEIDSWTDTISSLAVSAPTSGDRPAYDAAGDFGTADGTKVLSTASSLDLSIRNGAFTVVVVSKSPSDSGAPADYILAVNGSGGARSRLYILPDRFDFANAEIVFTKPYNDSPYIQIGTCEAPGTSVNANVFINGTADGSTTYTPRNTSASEVGIFGHPNLSPDEKIIGSTYHILFFSEILSESDRQKVEGWAAHTIGFADELPIGHPYKSVAP